MVRLRYKSFGVKTYTRTYPYKMLIPIKYTTSRLIAE